ncbi:hypothetical protein PVAND_010265 [Polypedilum vanderplanki]|uniref:Uncharacterized protein n=1 Tax=Polypedilum vanderplanki TaxID=319348 RepID=A0A9J6CG58_POLVA|nr:hypothetical protein PVAND_010265 [Polypedilum vanderplanki]
MSKYSSDLIGILRGAQLVASASIKSQEQYLKHIWSHSSVRDAIETNVKQTQECTKKIIENPAQEFQNVNHYIKETFGRGSVVVEGLRQYMANGRSSEPIGVIEVSEDSKSKSYSTIKNIQNLDIASVTLKELENLLAEHNKIREVNLSIDENFKPKKSKNEKALIIEPSKEIILEPKKEIILQPNKDIIVHPENESISKPDNIVDAMSSVQPNKTVEDEKQVDDMMKFITEYDKKPNSSATENKGVPEVRYYCAFLCFKVLKVKK